MPLLNKNQPLYIKNSGVQVTPEFFYATFGRNNCTCQKMKEKYKIAELNNLKLLALRPLPPETLKSLKDYYRIGLTYTRILRHEYIATLELAHTNDTHFIQFIAERIIATNDLLRLFANNGGVKHANGGAKPDSTHTDGGANALELLLCKTLTTNPGLNAPTLASLLGKSLRTTQRYLKKLSDDGKIEFRGAAKGGGYYNKT